MNLEITAPLIIRAYLWEIIKKNTDMVESDYNGLNPVIPLGQAPELEQFNKPFIVYGYTESASEDNPPCIEGNMTFIIYSTDFRAMVMLTNLLSRVFERKDEAANDINEYSSTVPLFLGLRFGHTRLTFVEGGMPEEEEGGRLSAVVGIGYEYYAQYNPITSIATWNPSTQKYIRS